MGNFIDNLNRLNIKKVGIVFLFLCLLISIAVFILPQLKNRAKLNLVSTGNFNITADNQDSLGVSPNTQFTITSESDIKESELKNSLVLFPQTPFEIKAVSSKQFILVPKQTLQNNQVYKIQIKTNQKDFSWAFQIKNEFRIVQTLPRDSSTGIPMDSGIEVIFSHDNWEIQKDLFTITPQTDGRFEKHGRTLSFISKGLKPGTLYTVNYKKGQKLNGTNESLKSDYSFQFETTNAEPLPNIVSLSKGYYEFSDSEVPAFDVSAIDDQITNIDVNVYKYPSESKFLESFNSKLSIPRWAYFTQRKQTLNTKNLSKIVTFNAPIQKQTYIGYFKLPELLPQGQYLVEIVQGDKLIQSLFQVTNVSTYFTQSGNKTLIWVNDASSGKPLVDAKVNYFENTQQTDQSGVAYFDTNVLDLQKGSTPISIKHPSGTLFIPLEDQSYYSGAHKYQSEAREKDKYWAYFYSDRPTYQPDDTVKFWGLLKKRENLSQNIQVTLEVTKTEYQSGDYTPIVLFQKDLTTSNLGTFLSEIPLKKFPTGWYDIDIKVSGTSIIKSGFSVETYVKPAYKMSLTPSSSAVFSGDKVTINGQVNFFEGSPVAGLRLKDTSYNASPGTNIVSDAQGKFSFEKVVSLDQNNKEFSHQSKGFSVSPLNPEEGLITADAGVEIFSSSLEFTYPQTVIQNNIGKVTIDLKKVDLNKYVYGQGFEKVFDPAPGKTIKVSTYEITWLKKEVGSTYDFINKKSIPKYEYSQSKNLAGETSIVTNDQGRAIYTINIPKDKSYEIFLESVDDQGRSSYQKAYLWSGAGQDDRDRYLTLKTDKKGDLPNSFQVGEKVNLSVFQGDNPLAITETDQFLYILSQRGIRSYHFSKDGKLSFNFPEEFSPNVYIQAIRFNGKTYQSTESLYLSFDTSVKKLFLSISLDKPFYQPADTAKISVSAKDAKNNPVASEVNLNLVDESYYRLYPDYLDPLSAVYRSLGQDILNNYMSHQYPQDLGGAEGGGCFLAGTQILMSNGKTKNIEDIEVGDIIKTKKSLTSSDLVSTKVLKKFTHNLSGYILINNLLRVTSEHNLYINGRWLTAGEVVVGDSYLGEDNNFHKVTSIETRSGLYTVYNLETEKYHTYFANGVYVHNEKGGSVFKDTAFFGTLQTNDSGKGSVEFKLPDNLTSWRISAQAISEELQVGSSNFPLVVKLPFFITSVLNTEYLVGDNPTINLRAYGEALTSEDSVTFSVESPTLGINKTYTGSAFSNVPVELGTLKMGIHKLTFTGTSSKGSYKLERSIKVLDSRLKYTKNNFQKLTNETALIGSTESQTSVIFSDENTGKFYPLLLDLASTWGDRLDQKIARSISQELIKNYFDDQYPVEKIDASVYQTPDGGLAIYPFASSDLQITAFVSALSKDIKINESSLNNYFYKGLDIPSDTVTLSKILFGIASQSEPVLLQVNSLLEDKKLNPTSQIYLGLALAKIGDTERAKTLYSTLLKEYLKTEDANQYVQIGNSKDEILENTSLMSAYASLLGEPESATFLKYTLTNSTKDTLLVLQKLLAISTLLQKTSPQDSSFTYQLGGKDIKVKLEKGKTLKLDLSPQKLKEIKFKDISGGVSVVVSYKENPDFAASSNSNTPKVNRSFSVNGGLSNQFKTADLVKVSLSYDPSQISQDGCYQITDILPSGLRVVTTPYMLGLSSEDITYPYEVDGQKVSFCVYNTNPKGILNYYARVINGGSFKAERVLIQSLISPSLYSFSDSSEVFIK